MNRNEIEDHKKRVIEENSSRKDAKKYKQTIEDILSDADDGLPRVAGAGEFFEGAG